MFKIGDKVKLVTDYFSDYLGNPIWGGKHGYTIGIVVNEPEEGDWVEVRWSNGRTNTYRPNQGDLSYVTGEGLKIGDCVKLLDYSEYEYPRYRDQIGTIISIIQLTSIDHTIRGFNYRVEWSDGLTSHVSAKNCYQVASPIVLEDIPEVVLPSIVVALSRRKFGIELETIYDKANKSEIARRCIEPRTGRSWIDFHSDSSIDGDGESPNTTEIVTSPLSGKSGIKKIITLCDELKRQNFRTNRSCGYHLHLSVGTILTDVEKIKSLILFYWIFEDVFFSFLPRSRQKNNYCRALREVYPNLPQQLLKVNTMADLEMIWYKENTSYYVKRKKSEKYEDSRYAWVNFHCLFARTKNLEIRSHNGTIDSSKIIPWILIHDRIISYIRDGKIRSRNLTTYTEDTSSLYDKREYLTKELFDLLKLPEDQVSYFTARKSLFTNGAQGSTEKIICVE